MTAERVARDLLVDEAAAQLRHAPIGALSQLAAGGLGGTACGGDEVRLGLRVGIAGRSRRAAGCSKRSLRGRNALGGRIAVVRLERMVGRQTRLDRGPVGRSGRVGVV